MSSQIHPVLPENYLRIATCGRAVGLKGDLSLWPISNVEQRFEKGVELFFDDMTSVVIESIRNRKDHYVVRFAGMARREDAEALVNKVLHAPALESDVLSDGEFFVHDCIDKTIVDQDGVEHGVVVRITPNAASDLLETDRGDLIPFQFITSIDDVVHVDVPEGLFGINEKSADAS